MAHTRLSRLLAAVAASMLSLAGLIGPAVAHAEPVVASASEGAAAPAHPPVPGDAEAESVPGRIVISWASSSSASERKSARVRHGLRTRDVFDEIGVEVVSLPERAVTATTRALNLDPAVEVAEPDFVVEAETDDPGYSNLWGLHNTGQTGGTADVDVDAPEAWQLTRGVPEVIVAVVDTGIDIHHPDLADNIWTNEAEAHGLPNHDDDGNGYIDDVHGWDFYTGDNGVYDSATEDDHGTHVAGTIAAIGDNGVGVVGLAPNVKIMPVKFLGGTDGTGSSSNAARAIAYAVDNGASVINASFGSDGSSSTLKAAISAAEEALVVAAAGNDSRDVDVEPSFPAAWAKDSYGMPNVLSVASIDSDGSRSYFSNVGAASIDLAAPGGRIYSTLPGGYGTYSGTSMAAPHAAAAGALVASVQDTLDGAGLAAALKTSVQPLASMAAVTTTGGLLNAHAAIATYVLPDAPIDVAAAAGNGRATVSWNASSSGGTPTGYAVTVSPAVDVSGSPTRTVTGATTLAFEGLTNGTEYTFAVAASNAGGFGPASAASAPVIPTATAPGAPTDVSAADGDGHAIVSWSAPDDGGEPITRYAVRVTPADGVTGDLDRAVDASGTSLAFDGLTNGTSYTFDVIATNAIGDSPASPGVTVTPRVLLAPAAPTNVTASAGNRLATVTWRAPADDGGRPIGHYTVVADPGGQSATTSATSVDVAGLTNGEATTFTVTATNAIGTSAASEPSAPVTPLAPPPPPSGGGGGGFSPAPAPAPAPGPVDEPVDADPGASDPDTPTAVPYSGSGSRSLDWACPGIAVSGFSDVPVDSPHAAGVGCASTWRAFTGGQDGAFQPAARLTRGQLASVLSRGIEQALGRSLPAGRDRFGDDDGSVHGTAIDKLAELGIVGGVTETSYAPGAPVTRGQFAAMLARTYRELAGGLPAGRDLFDDDDGSSHEASINGLAALGVVAGTGESDYQPGVVLNRAQAATMVARLFDALVEAGAATGP